MSLRTLTGLVCVIVAFSTLPSGISAAEKIAVEKGTADAEHSLVWYDIRLLGVEGQGWSADLKSPYDRLPAKAEGKAPTSVWGLSRHSTGLAVRFVTDARTIHARWTLINANLGMTHMPATGVSGLDLYVKDAGTTWRWLSVGQPKAQTNSVALVSGLPAGEREYLLYLPLYNGVSNVELGIGKNSFLAVADPRPEGHRKPILFYGTSITQGGCASRPGMVHTAIVGRRMNYPVINLGFSGSGKMEPVMADLLAEIDPAVYVLDCLPNMDAAAVTERVIPFVKKLRAAHPDTPILLVEDRTYTNSFLISGSFERNRTNRAALEKAYQTLQTEGVKHLAYLHGDKLLGADGEDTVDGSHPTDLGFLRHADAFQPALSSLLNP
ncbi:MAG: SGNH/GDSL hydrolase family protein [Planctomycetota bacterium]